MRTIKLHIKDQAAKDLRYHNLYLDLAERFAEESFCKRLKAGALAVKDDNIVGFGWNGAPSGMPNECEGEDGFTLPYILHAEENIFIKMARSTLSLEGATMYISHNPCIICARKIYQGRIKEVFYRGDYRSDEGLLFLLNRGIPVTKLEKE